MVEKIHIENYKSISSLDLELGRVNVLIGENGCGKTNILEALALGAAALEYKLDNEFLHSRGIRVAEPKLMRSGFDKKNLSKEIKVRFQSDKFNLEARISNDNAPFASWSSMIVDHLEEKDFQKFKKKYLARQKRSELNWKEWVSSEEYVNSKLSSLAYPEIIFDFLIYSPENSSLRNFHKESQIEPLSIKGEGLFKLLTVINTNRNQHFQAIKENLQLVDWFDDLTVPNDLKFTEQRLNIKDRYLDEELDYFDQRSSNEGFLFLLFYFTLFISDFTPKFFAIDNIESSLNPKLCREMVRLLTQLAVEHDKQVIFTTHNPAILDGLNLNDDQQRLFVISRNKLGHTKAKRITQKLPLKGKEPIRLSEQFMRGYFGGLPKNF